MELENSPSHEEYVDVRKPHHRPSNGQPQILASKFENVQYVAEVGVLLQFVTS